MPFCPNCKSEYIPSATRCSDCGALLVDQLPTPEVIEFDECDNCNGQVTQDSDFCIHCGALLSEEEFRCKVHTQSPALAVCIICRRLMCAECAKKKHGKMFCPEHKAVEVSEDWALAFKSTDYYEANIIRGKLESAGITVNPRNNNSIGFIADGFIESAIGRTILRYPVKVFVPLDQYLDAVEVLKEEFPLVE